MYIQLFNQRVVHPLNTTVQLLFGLTYCYGIVYHTITIPITITTSKQQCRRSINLSYRLWQRETTDYLEIVVTAAASHRRLDVEVVAECDADPATSVDSDGPRVVDAVWVLVGVERRRDISGNANYLSTIFCNEPICSFIMQSSSSRQIALELINILYA